MSTEKAEAPVLHLTNSNNSEKGQANHVEYADIEHKADEDAEAGHLNVNIDEGFDPDFVRRTVRKVDWRLIPVLTGMYCVSLVDRTNLSLARQANEMAMDHHIGTNLGSRYSIITLTFFVPVRLSVSPTAKASLTPSTSSLRFP